MLSLAKEQSTRSNKRLKLKYELSLRRLPVGVSRDQMLPAVAPCPVASFGVV